jgi:hypothetical protein
MSAQDFESGHPQLTPEEILGLLGSSAVIDMLQSHGEALKTAGILGAYEHILLGAVTSAEIAELEIEQYKSRIREAVYFAKARVNVEEYVAEQAQDRLGRINDQKAALSTEGPLLIAYWNADFEGKPLDTFSIVKIDPSTGIPIDHSEVYIEFFPQESIDTSNEGHLLDLDLGLPSLKIDENLEGLIRQLHQEQTALGMGEIDSLL